MCSLQSAQSFAQTNPSDLHGRGIEDQVTAIHSMLDLTEDQRSKLKPILQERAEKMATIMSDTALSQKTKAEKLIAIQNSTAARILTILTDEQKKHYELIQQKLKNDSRQK